jgi:hypothetical protein
LATIPIASIRPASGAAQITASDTGDKFQNDGRVQLNVQSVAGHDIVVTILAQRQPAWPLTCPDVIFTVPSNSFVEMYKLPPQWFNDPAGFVQLRYPPGEASNLQLDCVRNPDER